MSTAESRVTTKRATIDVINSAYERTQFTPKAGVWKDGACACVMTTLAIANANCAPTGANYCRANVFSALMPLGYSMDYMSGFIVGFDGAADGVDYSDTDWCIGIEDGKAARAHFLAAGVAL